MHFESETCPLKLGKSIYVFNVCKYLISKILADTFNFFYLHSTKVTHNKIIFTSILGNQLLKLECMTKNKRKMWAYNVQT